MRLARWDCTIWGSQKQKRVNFAQLESSQMSQANPASGAIAENLRGSAPLFVHPALQGGMGLGWAWGHNSMAALHARLGGSEV